VKDKIKSLKKKHPKGTINGNPNGDLEYRYMENGKAKIVKIKKKNRG